MANKKNGGEIPHCSDERIKWVSVGCGKCMECRKQKSRGWQVRLLEDMKVNKNGKFVTYTFSERELQKIDNKIDKRVKGYDRDNAICTYAVRHYTERWRKKYKKTLRHWLVTELGSTNTERVHMHGIVWTNEVEDVKKIWKYGKVYIGEYCTEQTVNYIVKYVNKVDEKHKEYTSKIYTSKGIGKNYIDREDSRRNKYKKGETKETYKTRHGTELALPIYYRNKIYSEEEKEKLWIEKLDKEKRYVCGVEVDVSKGLEEYYKVLKRKREANKRLGYGNDEINWEQKKYEQEVRNLKREQRIKKLWNTNA